MKLPIMYFTTLVIIIYVLPSAAQLPGDVGNIKSELEKGGRAVCQYCYGCMFTGLCGPDCSGNVMCDLCSFKFHCDTTCVTLCQRPDPCEKNICPANRTCQELLDGGTAFRCVCPNGEVCDKPHYTWPTQSIFAKFKTTRKPSTTPPRTTTTTTATTTTTTTTTTTKPATTTRRLYPTRKVFTRPPRTTFNPFMAAGTLAPPKPKEPFPIVTVTKRYTGRPYSTTGIPGYWFY